MFLRGIILLLGLIGFINAHADDKLLNKPEVQEFVQEMVKKDHFSAWQVRSILSQANYQPIIVEKMDMPYEAKPWDVYQKLFLTNNRINDGVKFYKEHLGVLKFVEKKYGVPAQIIVAILGVETTYGRQQGTFRVLDALTTLSFYYPKRAPYFQYELRQYLIMCRKYHLNPTQALGSYAGAMGQGQFMPSSYLRWAVSYQGNAAPDIINNANDAILSVANYLNKHGWAPNQKIAVKAQGALRSPCKNLQVNLKKATYNASELARCGLKPSEFSWNNPKEVGVVELLMSQKQPNEYWICYPDFYTILTYNSSPLYGLAVYLLGSSINAQL